MPSLEAWRPVALSRALRSKPMPVTVGARDLVLFRDGPGVGALDDRCPHRGMRLSRGSVRNGRLTCPYHGWSYCAAGHARSPGSPGLKLTTGRLDAAERHGMVWVREPGGTAPPPDEDEAGMRFIHSIQRTIAAPVASVMDNFTEVEHTGIAHWQFGYDPARLAEIDIETRLEPDCVRVRTTGPQRPLWPSTRLGFGIRNGMDLICEWETRFAPARSTWRWHWRDPKTGERRGRRFKAVAYFNPLPGGRTQLLTFYFWSRAAIDRLGFAVAAKPLMRLATGYEVSLDSALIEGLAEGGRGIPPTGASRFDKALVEQRRRLEGSE